MNSIIITTQTLIQVIPQNNNAAIIISNPASVIIPLPIVTQL